MAKKKVVKKRSKKPVNKQVQAVLKKQKERALFELRKAKEKFMKQEKKVRNYVKKNPEKAVAIAAGLGAAIGAAVSVVARRKKKR